MAGTKRQLPRRPSPAEVDIDGRYDTSDLIAGGRRDIGYPKEADLRGNTRKPPFVFVQQKWLIGLPQQFYLLLDETKDIGHSSSRR